MVTIRNLHEEEKEEKVNTKPPEETTPTTQELTPKEIEDIQKRNSRTLNPSIVTTEETKKERINVRVSETMKNTLNTYTELNGITISNFIEEVLTEKFEGRKVNRDYYPINETYIALPNTVELIQDYIEAKTNLIVDKSEITNEFPINPQDKQYSLFKSKNSLLNIMSLFSSNNYLDQWDNKEKVYYSTVRDHITLEYDVFKELEEEGTEAPPENLLKNHLGLIVYPTLTVKEYNSETRSYEEKELEVPLCYYLLIHEYNNRITKVQLISETKAIKLAMTVDNMELLEYLNNIQDLQDFQQVRHSQDIIDYQNKIIYELEERNHDLKEENRKLREYNKSKDKILKEEEDLRYTINPVAVPEDVLENMEEKITELEKKEETIKNVTDLLLKLSNEVSKDKEAWKDILKDYQDK